MPAHNEQATIERAIERVLAVGPPLDSFELIVVDDGSTDATGEILTGRQWPDQVRLLRNDRNRGKGHAIRYALSEAQGTYSAILDADLEYDPADLPRLVEPLKTQIRRSGLRHPRLSGAFGATASGTWSAIDSSAWRPV